MSDPPGLARSATGRAVSGDEVAREVERIRAAAEAGVMGAVVEPHLVEPVRARLVDQGWRVMAHVDGALSMSR